MPHPPDPLLVIAGLFIAIQGVFAVLYGLQGDALLFTGAAVVVVLLTVVADRRLDRLRDP